MKINYLILILILILTSNQIISQNYASMYIANNNSNLLSGTLTAGSQLQITGFTAMENHSNWSLVSDALTPNSSSNGTYLVRYSLSFEATPGIWSIGVFKNGVEQIELSNIRKIATGGQADVGNVAGSGFIAISSSSDVITFVVTSDTDATIFTPTHAQIILVDLDENTSPCYAEMYINNNTTSQSIGASFVPINNYSTGTLEGWSFSSNQLTSLSGSGGKYFVVYSMSFYGSGPEEYDFGLSINGSNPSNILLRRKISANNTDIGNVVATGIIDISENDVISIYGKADGTGKSITANYSNLSLVRIAGEDNSSSFANMCIANNLNATTIISGWNKETNFSTGSHLNNWTFDSADDCLVAGVSTAGIYIVNYHLGITLASDKESVNAEVTIFLNEVEQTKMSNRRLLPSKANDVGSISGNGVLTVLSSSDNITLRLKDSGTNNVDFIVKSANVNLFSIKVDTPLPVELTSFTANVSNNLTQLYWETATEVNNYGYEVQRVSENTEWNKVGFVNGHGNSNSPKFYSYTDNSVTQSGEYFYRLKQIDIDGTFEYSDVVEAIINTPSNYTLKQNYPNPFNPTTNINFSIRETGLVELKVYDILGNEVAEVVNENMTAGNYSYEFDASFLANGLYFYTIRTGNFIQTRKMILLK